MAKKMMGSAKAMMNPKGGKGMGTGGRTKNPADKMKSGPMQGGKISATTRNKKY